MVPDEFEKVFMGGELEELRSLADADKKVIELPDDAVSQRYVMGRDYVEGCPCNYAESVARLLWENREKVVKYLAARNAKVLTDAASLEVQLDRLEEG